MAAGSARRGGGCDSEAPPFRKERECGNWLLVSEFCFTEVPDGRDGFN